MRYLLLVAFLATPALARDQTGEHHDWVHGLHSPAGAWCCDISDGHTITDADWQTKNGRYQVRIDREWIDVPEGAVIGEPNRIGVTIVWYYRMDGNPVVTCFLPGSGA